ncbi:MAG: MFS transporter [Minisyncoccia bacterium]
MSPALESNIWKYTVLLVTNKRVFAAIIGVYYLTIPGVTPFWIGIFLLAGNGASFVFDIPSSYIADKIGHKDALVLSRGIIFLSTFFFLFATNVWWLVIGSVLMSMGFAFLSGVGSAFMHETLRAIGREGEYRTVMGKASSIGFALPAVMAALVPFSVGISYKIPFIVMLVLDMVGLMVALALVRPPVPQEHVAEVNETKFLEVIRQGLALRFFRIATFSGIVSAVIFAVDGFRGPYQLLLGLPVIWFGVFFGVGRGLASLLLAYSGKIHRLIGDVYSFQRMQIIVYGALLLALGFITNPWIVVVIFVLDNGLRYGLGQVDTGYQLDIIRNHRFKATLLSAGNQIQNVISMCVVALLGIAIEHFGYQHSFLIVAIVFLAVLVPLHFYIVRHRPLAE